MSYDDSFFSASQKASPMFRLGAPVIWVLYLVFFVLGAYNFIAAKNEDLPSELPNAECQGIATLAIEVIDHNLDTLFMPMMFLILALLLHVITSYCVWKGK